MMGFWLIVAIEALGLLAGAATVQWIRHDIRKRERVDGHRR